MVYLFPWRRRGISKTLLMRNEDMRFSSLDSGSYTQHCCAQWIPPFVNLQPTLFSEHMTSSLGSEGRAVSHGNLLLVDTGDPSVLQKGSASILCPGQPEPRAGCGSRAQLPPWVLVE